MTGFYIAYASRIITWLSIGNRIFKICSVDPAPPAPYPGGYNLSTYSQTLSLYNITIDIRQPTGEQKRFNIYSNVSSLLTKLRFFNYLLYSD